jgi:hypothetical protein
MTTDADTASKHARERRVFVLLSFVLLVAFLAGLVATAFHAHPIAGFLAVAALSWWLLRHIAATLRDNASSR